MTKRLAPLTATAVVAVILAMSAAYAVWGGSAKLERPEPSGERVRWSNITFVTPDETTGLRVSMGINDCFNRVAVCHHHTISAYAAGSTLVVDADTGEVVSAEIEAAEQPHFLALLQSIEYGPDLTYLDVWPYTPDAPDGGTDQHARVEYALPDPESRIQVMNLGGACGVFNRSISDCGDTLKFYNGESQVVLDPWTGDILAFNVVPEDRPAFRELLTRVRVLDAPAEY